MTSKNPKQAVRFYFLNGVENVRVTSDRVTGQWLAQLPVVWSSAPSPGKVVEELVNVQSDLNSIARFTRKFGPLTESAQEGKSFTVDTEKWLGFRDWTRELWSQLRRSKPVSWQGQVDSRDQLAFDYGGGRLIYHASTLEQYLRLDLFSLPHERLKMCFRDGCPHPYFIARHLRQQYCSEPCAWIGLRKSKLDWYYRKTGRPKGKSKGVK